MTNFKGWLTRAAAFTHGVTRLPGNVETVVEIAPPGPDDAETLGALPDVAPELVLVHQVVGITARERKYAIRHGSERLWEALLALRQPLLVDEARPEVVA